ncbi:type II toxin-antitoxin system prevent-host-death family antitoxin [uncultured Tateyamaria sp.]|uniref:type II toxin-antitoxin system prevent-host-death family antitoxin n=1 Tax=uncultured Tateyamaria sp. TaxID=455651 RepID=UPI002625B2AA|nr:type II toxin-antitoxin system prevent-host-death family antitoxin [uncultured Tateyamaria sp.]
MKQFSSTELANRTGDVLAAAAQRPVTIAKHGKARFVVLTTEQFEAMQQSLDTRRSVHVSELDDAEASALISALQDSIEND